jgi:hypothetical protein
MSEWLRKKDTAFLQPVQAMTGGVQRAAAKRAPLFKAEKSLIVFPDAPRDAIMGEMRWPKQKPTSSGLKPKKF